MRFFITGIGGFLGSHLADAFLKLGHEVSGMDNFIGGYPDNVPEGADFREGNCGDFEAVRKAMEGSDVVYHCACTAYEGLSVFSPSLVTHNTSGITASVLSASVAEGVKRFVYCSSMARYGNQKAPFTEDMPCKPQDPYGIAKVASEMLVRNLCQTHGMEYSIAVPHNIIGPRQKYDDPFRNVASIMANMMLQGRQPFIYGDGEQVRCFSFVKDVVDPLVRMAFSKECVGETINVGPDKGSTSINGLAETLADIIGFRGLKPIHVDDRPCEVKTATCSAQKARDYLGYEPKTSLREGLESIVDYIRERGTRDFKYHLPLEITNEKTPKTWAMRLF